MSAVVLVVLVGFVAAAGARTSTISFTRAPATALQGKLVKISVATKPSSSTRCKLSVTYADGIVEQLGQTLALRGLASWAWRVPEVAQPGRARLSVSCAGAGRATRLVTVVGTLIPPKIVVVDQGFSVRTKSTGSEASFWPLAEEHLAERRRGERLRPRQLRHGRRPGDRHQGGDDRCDPAGTTYAYGGSLRFPGGAPVARLEVVVKVGDRQRHTIYQPLVQSIGIVPGLRDAMWVGEVNGEIVNNHVSLNVSHTRLSAVVFDAAGAIVGGGSGSATALLPPGTRQVFKITSGVDAIPWARAARAPSAPFATYTP